MEYNGGILSGGFCPGGFCPRGDFVQGDFVRGGFVWGDFVLEPSNNQVYHQSFRKKLLMAVFSQCSKDYFRHFLYKLGKAMCKSGIDHFHM